MIDIHSHILPGLDDGAGNMDEALAMLRLAGESGTTDIVATPHANAEFTFQPDLIGQAISSLQAAAGAVPRIHCGCDFHLTMENIQDALKNPGKYSVNHLNYLLVEFSDFLIPRTTQEIFDRLQSVGLIPIITHPERNVLLHSRLDQLQSWVENGALVQVTGGSFLGIFGKTARAVATDLMNRNLVHFVASDAHDSQYRTPDLREAYHHVASIWSGEVAERLFITSPRAVISGHPIQASKPLPLPAKKKWYRLGF